MWDSTTKFTGPLVRPHTNWTEIETELDLLWRNEVDLIQVTLGIGWYGRSFTLSDPSCNSPGCMFSAGGNPGQCTGSTGTLSNAEVDRIISSTGVTLKLIAKQPSNGFRGTMINGSAAKTGRACN